MCGIVGELSLIGNNRITDEWVRKACQIMAHRGPDGEGIYCDSEVALGHRRLSIIDLSTGKQPMSFQEDRYWITYNGEIYNFIALREKLEQMGVVFKTKSDTEVILAAYAHWGLDFIKMLNGIFAFAIWDNQEKILLLVRDHLGVKPLLYHMDDNCICFASELKALLSHPHINRQLNPHALQDYLMLGYVLSPKTILSDIYRLPPGHYLIARQGRVQVNAYWNLVASSKSHEVNPDEIFEFDRLLKTSVEEQMVSDVPLGAFLSGGIDSSAIVFHANRATTPGTELKTFSIGFKEASYSELEYAQHAAKHLGSQHYQKVVHPLTMDKLADLVWYYDEPLGDTSLIPTYFVSKLARQYITVSLSGDGGDELLAGYDTYLADWVQNIYFRCPSWLHYDIISPVIHAIPSTYRKVSIDYLIKQFVSQAYQPPERAHFGWRMMFDYDTVLELSGSLPQKGSYHPFEDYSRHFRDITDGDWLQRFQYVDIKTWLVDDILVKVDRASMACRLEARVPFLNCSLVEFAFNLPIKYKLRGLKRKWILREAMKEHLPRLVLQRRKRGFNAPVGQWMRNELSGEINTIFKSNASNIIDLKGPRICEIWDEHRSGHRDHGFKLWTLLSLILWEKKVLEAYLK